MSIPAPDIPVPAKVRALAGAAELTPVWINDYGGVTFQASARQIAGALSRVRGSAGPSEGRMES